MTDQEKLALAYGRECYPPERIVFTMNGMTNALLAERGVASVKIRTMPWGLTFYVWGTKIGIKNATRIVNDNKPFETKCVVKSRHVPRLFVIIALCIRLLRRKFGRRS